MYYALSTLWMMRAKALLPFLVVVAMGVMAWDEFFFGSGGVSLMVINLATLGDHKGFWA